MGYRPRAGAGGSSPDPTSGDPTLTDGATVLLVGAGAVGGRAARQLVETPGIARLLVASRDLERAERLSTVMAPHAEPLDWKPGRPLPGGLSAIACALRTGADAAVAQAAIAAGIPIVSAGDDSVGLAGLEVLDGPARAAGVLVAAGAGLAPGLADVLARHASDALEHVDEVGVARFGAGGEACVASSRRARRERPAEVRDGLLVPTKRTGHELVWFPDPVGAQECQLVAPGVALLQHAFPDAQRVSVRMAEPEARSWWQWPRKADAESWGALRVEVWGRRGRLREVLVYGVIERTAIAAGAVLGVTAAALAGALPGLLLPEVGTHGLGEIVAARAFLAELAGRGVKAAVFEGVPVA
ncbi:MAG: hypothetical protein FJW88_00060 [Actinobacteria bacterium]|nr:hypothetical protein [Actinomycetota bacterium]